MILLLGIVIPCVTLWPDKGGLGCLVICTICILHMYIISYGNGAQCHSYLGLVCGLLPGVDDITSSL